MNGRSGLRIGVDVGGTNTDAVLLSDRDVLATVKVPTTSDVGSGIVAAVRTILEQGQASPAAVEAVMIGTTHFTNAFVQRHDLAKVHCLRLGLPASRGVPPFSGWPDDVRDAVCAGRTLVRGGYEFDGRTIGELDENAVEEVARTLQRDGVGQLAISGIFSQINDDQERRAAQIVQRVAPEIEVSLSSELGRTGLIERENAAIMNASLRPLAEKVATAFADALATLGLDCPYYVSQNDGTLMSADHMRSYPVLTFAAGPTNSLRGAAWLTGASDAIVVDIGGTTSDVGVLVKNFPRQSSVHVDVGGVRTNFRMPDVLSVGLGGGSRVREQDGVVTVGPDSVGYRLTEEALIFGGEQLTASDIAVAGGWAQIGDREKLGAVDAALVTGAAEAIRQIVATTIDKVKTSPDPMPMILVGGGGVLVNQEPPGVSEMMRPDHAGVANAIGAAIGQVSGEVDSIFAITDPTEREHALEQARKEATDKAIEAGAAAGSVEITDIETFPLQYLPGGATRVFCRAVGDLAIKETVGG